MRVGRIRHVARPLVRSIIRQCSQNLHVQDFLGGTDPMAMISFGDDHSGFITAAETARSEGTAVWENHTQLLKHEYQVKFVFKDDYIFVSLVDTRSGIPLRRTVVEVYYPNRRDAQHPSIKVTGESPVRLRDVYVTHLKNGAHLSMGDIPYERSLEANE